MIRSSFISKKKKLLSKEDFIAKYNQFSDQDLYQMYMTIDEYSPEAKEALSFVLNKRGGIEKIEKQLLEDQVILAEINRITEEVDGLTSKETNPDFIKNLITSDKLSKDQINQIIEKRFQIHREYLSLTTVNSKTIVFAILGILTSSIPAGILWNWLLKESNKIPVFLMLAIVLFCYFIIILFTKKSRTSGVVIISTIVAMALSALIGQLFDFS